MGTSSTEALELISRVSTWLSTGIELLVAVAAFVLWLRLRGTSLALGVGLGLQWLLGLVWGLIDLLEVSFSAHRWTMLSLSALGIGAQLVILLGVAILPARKAPA